MRGDGEVKSGYRVRGVRREGEGNGECWTGRVEGKVEPEGIGDVIKRIVK